MKVRLAKEKDKMKWDSYLEGCGFHPPLNYYGWKHILERSYGLKTFFFMALDENEDIQGTLPTYLIKDFRNNKRLYSLRFGLNGSSNEIKNSLLLHLSDFCRERGIRSNSLTSGYHRINTDFKSAVKKTLMLDLGKDEESTWRSFRDKTRNMIRKGVKSGLTAEKGFHNLKEFHRIYRLNMLSKGIPAHSFRFFKNIAGELGDTSELIVAKKDGLIIAGIFILFARDVAIYPFQASIMDYHKFAPNIFLIWEAIKSCLDKRIYKLDMGESTEGGDVYIFKTNVGGRPRDIYYYTALTTMKNVFDGDIEDRLSTSLVSRILLKTPLSFRKRLGIWAKRRERII